MTSSEPLYIVKLIVIIQQTSSDFQLASKHFFNFAEAKVEYKIAPKNPNVDNSAACLSVPFPYNPTFLNVGRSLLLATQISIGDMRVCGCFGRH